MNIFFDHQTFSQQLYGGVSRYFCELISGINSTEVDKAHLSLLWSNNIHLKEYQLQAFHYPFPKKNRLLQTSNKIFNTLDCKIGRYDLFHATYFDPFMSDLIGSKPFVTTFYDMTYERLSHQFPSLAQDTLITKQKKEIALRASHLIAISHSTKQDMVDILGISPDRISVIHLGSSSTFSSPESNLLKKNNDRPYFLYVGNRSGYKNFKMFLKASVPLLKKYDVEIICAGGGVFTRDEISLINSFSIHDQIKHIPINDEILADLYRNAISFIFPSLYEGFGIPVLEAFSCNCPCVISDVSSLPEVAGNAALYFNPLEKESIVNALEQVLLNPSLRDKLVNLGRIRLALFSWQSTVNQRLIYINK